MDPRRRLAFQAPSSAPDRNNISTNTDDTNTDGTNINPNTITNFMDNPLWSQLIQNNVMMQLRQLQSTSAGFATINNDINNISNSNEERRRSRRFRLKTTLASCPKHLGASCNSDAIIHKIITFPPSSRNNDDDNGGMVFTSTTMKPNVASYLTVAALARLLVEKVMPSCFLKSIVSRCLESENGKRKSNQKNNLQPSSSCRINYGGNYVSTCYIEKHEEDHGNMAEYESSAGHHGDHILASSKGSCSGPKRLPSSPNSKLHPNSVVPEICIQLCIERGEIDEKNGIPCDPSDKVREILDYNSRSLSDTDDIHVLIKTESSCWISQSAAGEKQTFSDRTNDQSMFLDEEEREEEEDSADCHTKSRDLTLRYLPLDDVGLVPVGILIGESPAGRRTANTIETTEVTISTTNRSQQVAIQTKSSRKRKHSEEDKETERGIDPTAIKSKLLDSSPQETSLDDEQSSKSKDDHTNDNDEEDFEITPINDPLLFLSDNGTKKVDGNDDEGNRETQDGTKDEESSVPELNSNTAPAKESIQQQIEIKKETTISSEMQPQLYPENSSEYQQNAVDDDQTSTTHVEQKRKWIIELPKGRLRLELEEINDNECRSIRVDHVSRKSPLRNKIYVGDIITEFMNKPLNKNMDVHEFSSILIENQENPRTISIQRPIGNNGTTHNSSQPDDEHNDDSSTSSSSSSGSSSSGGTGSGRSTGSGGTGSGSSSRGSSSSGGTGSGRSTGSNGSNRNDKNSNRGSRGQSNMSSDHTTRKYDDSHVKKKEENEKNVVGSDQELGLNNYIKDNSKEKNGCDENNERSLEKERIQNNLLLNDESPAVVPNEITLPSEDVPFNQDHSLCFAEGHHDHEDCGLYELARDKDISEEQGIGYNGDDKKSSIVSSKKALPMRDDNENKEQSTNMIHKQEITETFESPPRRRQQKNSDKLYSPVYMI